MTPRAHLIVGGFPAGAPAGHDMDFARRSLLGYLGERADATATTANDFQDLARWLDGAALLLTYVAGPFPAGAQIEALKRWLHEGGRWFALHGTSGGRAVRVAGQRQRRMVREAHHETLGCFFLNHPPVRRFDVQVRGGHPLTADLPPAFETVDELYLVEPIGASETLLTTELPDDPSPPGFGFQYDEDTSLGADGKTRVLGHVKEVGQGQVAYVALGHCHHPASNSQPFVDEAVAAGGVTPRTFRGSWEIDAFQTLMRNAVAWGFAN